MKHLISLYVRGELMVNITRFCRTKARQYGRALTMFVRQRLLNSQGRGVLIFSGDVKSDQWHRYIAYDGLYF